MSDPTSSSLLWHYMASFMGYTLLVACLIIGGAVALKRNPRLLAMVQPYLNANNATPAKPLIARLVEGFKGGYVTVGPTGKTAQLKVEEALNLEPGKTLFVVSHGNQRFLLASCPTQTNLISLLQPQAEPVTKPTNDTPNPVAPSTFAPTSAQTLPQAPPPVTQGKPTFNFNQHLVSGATPYGRS